MAIGGERWETVSVDRGNERHQYAVLRDHSGRWQVGAWSRLARKASGDWDVVESWSRSHSRDAWEPELTADVLAKLQRRLARGRSIRAAVAGLGALAIAAVAWTLLL